MTTTVAALRCQAYQADTLRSTLERQFQLLGGLEQWIKPGDQVLLKPNFIAPKPVEQPCQTHPAIIIETARLVKDLGAHPFVADSPAWGSITRCATELKLLPALEHLGVPLKPMDQARSCRINNKTKVSISTLALEADKIINLPKLKAHQQMIATLALKNMFGCVIGKQKPYWHFARGKSRDYFADFLIDLYKTIPATLNIIDGIIAMQGNGPIHGEARDVGWLITGTDAVACEMICSQIIQLPPDQVPLLRAAQRAEYGCYDFNNIDCVGDPIKDGLCDNFEIPPLIPIRFSLPRVAKSIAKGFVKSLVGTHKKTA